MTFVKKEKAPAPVEAKAELAAEIADNVGIRIGQPGIVYFAPTNRGKSPSAAMVTRVGGPNGSTLTLTVFGQHGSVQHVTGVSHYKDPSFDLNPERDANVGSWAFFDEI